MNHSKTERTPSDEGALPRLVEERWRRGEPPDVDGLLAGAGPRGPAEVAAALAVDQWHRWHAGRRVPAEDYLARHPAVAADPAAALELIYGEFLVREELGERPAATDYLARFPAHAAPLRGQFELHAGVSTPIDPFADTPAPPRATPVAGGLRRAARFAPGTLLAGRYQLGARLGSGGMGEVYSARDLRLGRDVAVKVVPEALARDPDCLARFEREARAAAALAHPNVLVLHDFGCEQGVPFAVTELLDGADLHRRLAGGAVPWREAVAIGAAVAEGLAAAHARGIVHRDIKPANLFLTADGRVKILDFGLARVVQEEGGSRLTSENTVMGTLDYLAPEQAADARAADIRADIYSLGCTLYHLLTGRPPFLVTSPTGALLAHTLRRPEPVHALRPDVPATLSALVSRMLAKDPSDRPQTPAEVARELAPFLRGEVTVAAPLEGVLSPTERAPEWRETLPRRPRDRRPAAPPAPRTGRWRTVAFGVAAGAAVVLSALFLAARFRSDPESTDPQRTPPRPGELLTLSLPSGLGMKCAWIPPGEFRMGCDRFDAEKPVRKVTLTQGFYLGVFPVTQAQWRAVMNANPSDFKGDDRPVESVSWDDCQTFCRKLGEHNGKRVRLPTEAEWEYACRAGTTTDYYSGDGEEALRRVAWYIDNSGKQTHPVGKLAPNAWGLYDMHGNVWQWCQDWYGPYADLGTTDPVRRQQGPENARIVRGGSWNYDRWGCRAACRFWFGPAFSTHIIGVRVAVTPE